MAGNRGQNNQGERTAAWWDRYNPGPFDPRAPYYEPPRRHKKSSGLGNFMGEQDREAAFARMLGRHGINYTASPHPYSQFLMDQFRNAELGYRATTLDRPNLTWRRYLQRNPAFNFGSDEELPPPPNSGQSVPGRGPTLPERFIPESGMSRQVVQRLQRQHPGLGPSNPADLIAGYLPPPRRGRR